MNLCIDASNIRLGGGVTHLVELLNAADPNKHGINNVIVWGGKNTLAKLPERSWLNKINPDVLNRGLLHRILWQRFSLSRLARDASCDVLFVPGGSYAGNFWPIVTMSQNLLPFEWAELRRYGCSFNTLKYFLLRYTQSSSFQNSDGVIFLTEYAKHSVQDVTGYLSSETVVIPHGLNFRFQINPKVQHPIANYSDSNPFSLLYVSIIDQYKHQWHVVEAVHKLRQSGLPIILNFVGPAYPPSLNRLQSAINQYDPEKCWVKYYGSVPYEFLHDIYAQADLGIFASSCENMPIILLETMAAGLPVACSNRGPMPEVLGNAGLYFDPENPATLSKTILDFINSPLLRNEKAYSSFARSQQYSWSRCADQTFAFFSSIANKKRTKF
ncbi:glycosyltransferase involved in cell wall biosynthesis [Desulfomicrobium macestii]|uniref:Glycosyltransferase involved in cell wall biosynthesis n=1 Tax=Desulfomicrobium macestii TaxID=90731 RepID=A0ABR9H5G5_9BACT|nr:glycosyltransferase family 1 protein [Desulfomicrobium macestii]MBE1425959.1 glycosyltransferase involved in cell wall biosynthesis [Desulfomicrobium macestii]